MDIGALMIHFIYCHHRTMWSDFYQILTGIGGTHFSKYRSIFHQFMDYVLCTRNENWVKAMCFIHIYALCVTVTLYYHITFSGPFKVIVWYAFLSPRVSIL